MNQKNKIILSPKYKELFKSNSRYCIITGGRGSSKSFSISTFLALLMFEEGHVILYTRLTMSSAHLSIIPEFVDKLEQMNLTEYFEVNKGEIINKSTGSKIIFKGLKSSSGDQSANLKSLQGVTTWVMEEGEELTDESIFDKINFSVRTNGIQNRIILILNPATKEHWIYKRFFQSAGVIPGSNLTKDDVTYIHTTYRDNIKNLDKSFVNEISKLKETNINKYNLIVEGHWQDAAEGVIFKYEIGDYDNTLTTIYGQDFGFSWDPTTLVAVAIDRKLKRIYLDEKFSLQALTTTQIAELNRTHCGSSLIIADSAEPRLISEVRSKGINIKPVSKYPGSIVTGIMLMQDYQLIVTKESINLIKELNHYTWLEKKSNTPIDKYNHIIDAVRYVIMEAIGKTNSPLASRFK
jgi:phage terminase large subunit